MHDKALQTRRSLTATVVSDPDQFQQLHGEWEALLQGCTHHSFFMRHEWCRLWWKHCAPADGELRLICCRTADGDLVGIAPFYLRHHSIYSLASIRELCLLGTGIELKTSEGVDVLSQHGLEREVAAALASMLRRMDDWDRIYLHQIKSESRTAALLAAELRLELQCTSTDAAPFIDTSTSWHQYKSSLGRSMRRNVEYYSRRLFNTYACEFQRAETNEQVEIGLRNLIQLHQGRWIASGQPGSFSGPELVNLLMEVAQQALDHRHIRIWTLAIDGNTQAALLGFLDNGVLHYFQKGFNAEFMKDDLGTAMLSLCLRDSFTDPDISAFDFMGGGAAYKALWARQSRSLVSHALARKNFRVAIAEAGTSVTAVTKGLLRRITPDILRAMRRDYLQRKRLKLSLESTRKSALKLALPVWEVSNQLAPFLAIFIDTTN